MLRKTSSNRERIGHEREREREREISYTISNATPLVSRPTVQNNDIVLNFTWNGCVYSVPFDLVAHFIAEHFEETIFPAMKPIQSPNVMYVWFYDCSKRDQLFRF